MRSVLVALGIWLALASPAFAAIGTPTSLGSTAVTSTTTTVAITTAANIAAGDLVVILSSSASSITGPTGATDSGGVNTYTCSGGSTAPTLNFCYAYNASAVASGGTVTTTGWSSTSAAKTSAAFTVSGMMTTALVAPATGGAASSAANTTTGTTSATAVAIGPFHAQPALVLGFLTGTADMGTITMAGWSNIVTNAAGGEEVSIWYKIATTYAKDATWAPSWVATKKYRSFPKWFIGASPVYAPFGQANLLGIGQ